MTGTRRPFLLGIVGPTASGKSDLAVEVVETLAGAGELAPEIINADSVQFFTGVDIGAAKPSAELLNRAPHHLIGHLALGAEYNAGDFRRDAVRVIAEGAVRGLDRFILAGGSGFYVQALEKGMYDVPVIKPETRAALEREAVKEGGLARLHAELKERDPGAVEKIYPGDAYRIVRSLEILRSHLTGESLSQIKERFRANDQAQEFDVVKIGLNIDRDRLRLKASERVKRMLADGLIDEVKSLREKGLREWAPLNSVGYREVQAVLDGTLALSALEDAMVTSTMQLAKKQMTWFKRDPDLKWFDAETGRRLALEAAVEALRSRSAPRT